MATQDQRFFSSGKLRIGAPGNTALTDSANLLGELQDVSISVKFDAKELYTAKVINTWPVDVGFHQGKANVKGTLDGFDRLLFSTLFNLAKVSGGGFDVYTFGPTMVPAFLRMELDVFDNSGAGGTGKIMTYAFTQAYAPGLDLAAAIADFGKLSLDFSCIADPNAVTANSVGTVTMAE